jgi:hypothetical protein
VKVFSRDPLFESVFARELDLRQDGTPTTVDDERFAHKTTNYYSLVQCLFLTEGVAARTQEHPLGNYDQASNIIAHEN